MNIIEIGLIKEIKTNENKKEKENFYCKSYGDTLIINQKEITQKEIIFTKLNSVKIEKEIYENFLDKLFNFINERNLNIKSLWKILNKENLINDYGNIYNDLKLIENNFVITLNKDELNFYRNFLNLLNKKENFNEKIYFDF